MKQFGKFYYQLMTMSDTEVTKRPMANLVGHRSFYLSSYLSEITYT